MNEERMARLMITLNCPRSCKGCCNDYPRIMGQARRISSLEELRDFPVVMITGGEPMINVDRTTDIIGQVRLVNPEAKIFLYTALYKPEIEQLLPKVDGIQFSLHEGATPADVDDFQRFQEIIRRGSGSYRLYVDPRVEYPIYIEPKLWRRVEIKPWLTEDELLRQQPNGLPKNEELLIFDADQGTR